MWDGGREYGKLIRKRNEHGTLCLHLGTKKNSIPGEDSITPRSHAHTHTRRKKRRNEENNTAHAQKNKRRETSLSFSLSLFLSSSAPIHLRPHKSERCAVPLASHRKKRQEFTVPAYLRSRTIVFISNSEIWRNFFHDKQIIQYFLDLIRDFTSVRKICAIVKQYCLVFFCFQ